LQVRPGRISALLRVLKKEPGRVLTNDEVHLLHAGFTSGIQANECRWALVTHNIGLARKACNHMRACSYYEDVVQFALTGIYHAVEKWEPSRNLRFSTYAMCWCMQRAYRYKYNSVTLIRVPEHAITKANQIKALTAKYKDEHRESPSAEWLAGQLRCSVKAMETARSTSTMEPVSYDQAISETGLTLIDWSGVGTNPSAEEVHLRRAVGDMITEALATLTPAVRDTVKLYFGIDCEAESFTKIAVRYGITKQAAEQRVSIALRRLKVLEILKNEAY
jgi:RNA polymerase sigma factor (sigma-70 family)